MNAFICTCTHVLALMQPVQGEDQLVMVLAHHQHTILDGHAHVDSGGDVLFQAIPGQYPSSFHGHSKYLGRQLHKTSTSVYSHTISTI